MPTVSYNLKYLILLVFALCFYSTEVYRPIDGTSKTVWREADGGAIARNFYQEGMNIFYPRIDWRGTGPGFVESELPLEPWLGAALYKTFGYQEWFLRLISMITMLGCCGVFFLLAQSLLNDRTAFLASVIFVIHPFIFLMSTAIQPEPFMLLGYLLAIYGFVRWIQTDQLSFYFLALLATPFAILAKIPAAHVGILFALMSLNKFGIKALFSFKLWAFAIFTLGIPILWYMHARSLWEIYGNSLGISNEAYENIKDYNLTDFIKVQIFGNLSIEFTKVWMFFGTLLAISGFYSFNKKKNGKIIIYWALALIIFYIVCGRTTGAAWAAYYHIVSIPLACLVMAEGYYYLIDRFISSREVRYLANALLFAVICFEVALFFYTEFLKTHQYE
jgi:4-amino-4-deoxy-L-arabinose transferase-like glycosyltransferase